MIIDLDITPGPWKIKRNKLNDDLSSCISIGPIFADECTVEMDIADRDDLIAISCVPELLEVAQAAELSEEILKDLDVGSGPRMLLRHKLEKLKERLNEN